MLLLAAAIVGWVLTRDRTSPASAAKGNQSPNGNLVDLSPLQTIEQLADLAGTGEEQDLAKQALGDADLSVDLAFTAALRDPDSHPPPPTPPTPQILTPPNQSP